jgi:hypothetical protein
MTPKERKALLQVREMLAAPEMPSNLEFNMSYEEKVTNCRTTACIGGHMALLMGHYPNHYVWRGRSDDLYPLFFPKDRDGDDLSIEWDYITKEHAVQAIDNFLKDGNPRWNEVVSQ